VGSTAKVHEFAVAIEADLRAGLGELGHEVRLHKVAVALELRQSLFARLMNASKRFIALDHFLHLLFDCDKVFGSEGRGPIEVIEEAGIRSGPVAEFGLRKELEHSRGEHVRSRVANHLERFRI
jgi:hypothetical protein